MLGDRMFSMRSLELKDIRIPSALMRERRPSVIYTLVQATFVALLIAVGSFFALNLLAIVAIGIVGAIQHRMLDFSLAYRSFAAPAAVGILVMAWLGCLIFFFRDRNR